MIKQFQEEFGIQNKELANLLGYSISSIQKWRSEEVALPPSVEKLIRLFSQVFAQDRDALLQWNQQIHPQIPAMPAIQKAPPQSSTETPKTCPLPALSSTLLDIIQDKLFCTNLAGIILFATPALTLMLGYPAHSLTGQHVTSILSSSDAQMLHRATSGAQSIFRASLSTHQNEWIPVETEVFFDSWDNNCIMIWRALPLTPPSKESMDDQRSSSELQCRPEPPATS